ncbi:MAG: multidrug transporter subunit MdtA [Proteobacteria bacterium]|nr:multidrug transporter subunit MdtA [Pseudomonadota bacterium]
MTPRPADSFSPPVPIYSVTMSDSSSLPPPATPSITARRTASSLRRRRLLLVACALVAAGGWYLVNSPAPVDEPSGPGAPGGAGRPTPIVVEAASTADFPVRLSAIGTVIPRTVVTVRSRVDGTLNRINFEEGQTVRAGDLLAEIDPRPFEVALTQVLGQMGKDEALLANARADLARYEGLAKLDAIPSQQLDTQRALVRQYEAAVRGDQGAVDNARLQLSYTRITAPASGRAGLRQVDPGNLVRSSDTNGIVVVTQVQPVTVVFPIPEADLGKLLVRLGMQTPRETGRAAGRQHAAGEAAASPQGRRERPADSGLAAAGRQRPDRQAALAEGKIIPAPAGRGGNPTGSGLAVEAWDRDGKVLLATGELLTVDNQLDVTTGTVKVKAIFPNKDGALFPNQFVNVRLVVNELKDAVVIPSAAVQRGAKGNFVWLLKEDKSVAMRPVEVGAADGERVPVLHGLAAGESVAVDGFDRLREGGKVEVVTRESRAVKEGPGKGGGRRGGRRGENGGPAVPGAPATPAAAAPAAPAGARPQP